MTQRRDAPELPDPSVPRRADLPRPEAGPIVGGWRFAGWILLLLAVLPYLGSLHGDFVWDDGPQILDNGILRDAGRWGEAFSSDVWAFKGESDRPWSTYWRPLFVLWLAVQYSLFGAGNALPWHLAAVALHATVTWLVWRVGPRLGLAPAAATAVAAIFAVHPAHVESVAWISGAPDPLGALFTLCAILAFTCSARSPGRTAVSALAYALALLCKESFAGLPLLLFAMSWIALPELATWQRLRTAARSVTPHLAILTLYLIARQAVLGTLVVAREAEPLSLLDWMGTAPRVLAFYLGHAILPGRLSPVYPLPIELPSASTFVATSLVLLAAAIFWRARHQRPVALGGALFLVFLAPVLHLGALDPIELVHDRYLYLPLLGCWSAVVGLLSQSLRNTANGHWRALARVSLILFLAVMVTRTATYARVWRSDLALWSRGAEVSPSSPTAWSHLGFAQLDTGDAGAALGAFDRALALRPDAHALTGRAQARLARGDRNGVAVDLSQVLAEHPAFTPAAEQLAALLQSAGRFAEAEALLERTIPLAPWRHCSLTTNLAVVLYLEGRKDEALAHLNAVDTLIEREPTTTCIASAFHRGALLDELGNPAEARSAYSRFLSISTGTTDSLLLRLRNTAGQRLERRP